MKIKLREIRKEDISRINLWRNDKDLVDYLGANYSFTSEPVDSAWYENYLKNRDKAVRLAIEDSEANRHIGNVYLTGIHNINRSAEFSIFIGEKDYWSQAIGEDVARKIVEHGFNDLNLNRIYLYVLANNERAIKLYKKLNFKEEGILREAVYKNGEFMDFVLMSVLKKDWNTDSNSRHETTLER